MKNFIVLGALTLSTIGPIGARARFIPDEINYRQFDRQLQELQERRNILESERSELVRDLSFAEAKLREIMDEAFREQRELDRFISRDREIQQDQNRLIAVIEGKSRELRLMDEELDSRRRSQSGLERELNEARREERSFRTTLERQTVKVAAIKSDYDQLLRIVQSLESSVASAQSQINSLEQTITRLESEIRSASLSITDKERELNGHKAQQRTLISDLRRLQAVINTLDGEVKNLERQVASKKVELEKVRRDLSGYDQKISHVKRKISELERELARLQRMPSRDQARIKQIKKEIEKQKLGLKKLNRDSSSLRSRVKSLARELDKLEQQQTLKQKSLATNQAKFKKLTDLQGKLPGIISTIEREISSLEGSIVQKTREKTTKESELTSKKRDLRALARSLSDKKRELESKNILLQREERELSSMHRSMQSILESIQGLERRIGENVNRINFLTRRIPELDREIDIARREIRELEKELTRNARMISQVQRRLVELDDEQNYQQREMRSLESAISYKDSEISQVSQDIAYSEGERNARYGLFQTYLAEARELGRDTAIRNASRSGERAGADIAANWGTRNGKFYGEKLGLLRGYVDGLIAGAATGKVEGLRNGRADDASFDQGHDDGYALGKSKAQREVSEIVYPNAYRSYRSSLLEKSIVGRSSGIENTEMPNRAEGVNARGIDDLIAEKESLYVDQNRPQNKYSQGRFAYSVPEVRVPSVGRACDDVYKNYEEFVQACRSEFENSYQSSYVSSYERAFLNDYESYYAPEFDQAFNSNKAEKFSTGKSEGYKIAYDEYFAKGANEIYQEGHSIGLIKGYEENIGEFSRIAKAKAERDARNFYTVNALPTMGSESDVELFSDAPKNELRSGAKVALRFTVRNVGGALLKSGDAKVRLINSSSNIQISRDWVSLASIPARGEIEVSDLLTFKIKEDASPGERIFVDLELKSSGDEVDLEYKESINVSKRVHVNPEVRVNANGNDKTRWRKWKLWPFKWEFNRESISVNLTGINEDVPGKYMIKIDQVGGPKVVKLDSAVEIHSPRMGRTSSGSIGYEFTKKVRKSTLKFKVSVWYDDELIQEREVQTFVK